MTSLTTVFVTQKQLFARARALVSKKGHDYNRKQQGDGDTLFNLKVSKLLGVVEHNTQGILVRLSDKFMRLCSLTSDPKVEGKVEDESVRDTIVDMINYLTYLYIVYTEERKNG